MGKRQKLPKSKVTGLPRWRGLVPAGCWTDVPKHKEAAGMLARITTKVESK